MQDFIPENYAMLIVCYSLFSIDFNTGGMVVLLMEPHQAILVRMKYICIFFIILLFTSRSRLESS
jgi:hypothetical protein